MLIANNPLSAEMVATLARYPHPYKGFEDNIYFVRYMLGRASDEKLSRIGMKPEERDALLSKEVEVFKHKKSVQASGHFHSKKSKKKGVSVISYSKDMDNPFSQDDSLDTAAHELLHAARFWQSARNNFAVSLTDISYALFAGVVINACFKLPPLINLGISFGGLISTGVGISLCRKAYKEEVDAYRFGAHFSKSSYLPLEEDFEADVTDKINLAQFLGAYPKPKKITKIYLETAEECINGNGFFSSADNIDCEYQAYIYNTAQAARRKHQDELIP